MGTPTDTGAGGALITLWRRWMTPARFWWGLLVIVLAGSAAFGGLDYIDPKAKYVDLDAGETFRGHQFNITVHSAHRELQGWAARVGLTGPWRTPPPPGAVYLVIEADVQNMTSETQEVSARSGLTGSDPGQLQAGFTRDKLVGLEGVRLDYPADSKLVQPGLTNRMAFITTAPADKLRIGTPIIVQINDFEYLPRTGPREGNEWQVSDTHGVYHLNVEDSR